MENFIFCAVIGVGFVTKVMFIFYQKRTLYLSLSRDANDVFQLAFSVLHKYQKSTRTSIVLL